MQFDDIQQQASIDLARFIAPNHFDYREHTPAAYSEIAEPLVRQRMGLTNRELCAAKALALWAQFEKIERPAIDLLVSDSGDTPKIMPRHEALRIDALRHNVCKAAHDYAKQVGDALLIEAWPKPVWMPNADTQPQAGNDAPVVKETPEQRRARWLDWHGEGGRGALQRVYERELPQNPKADRSYIGKQIRLARTEQAEKRRGGGWVSQLVNDGKRSG